MKVLLTGSQGFIGSYVCSDLLNNGYSVVGIDNYSKYGPVTRKHDFHKNFQLIGGTIGECSQSFPFGNIIDYAFKEFGPFDFVIAGAAMIGGISYFHKFAYDLLRTNEKILCDTFDASIRAYQNGQLLNRVCVLSSSMVFENVQNYPTLESDIKLCPPPDSTYGFQKLSSEYFAKGAHEQYGLPYTIIRPFNCVGAGEDDSISEHEVMSGNVKLMMSHVMPDLINKCLKGQDPLHILGSGRQIRCYTNGKDLARGLRMAMESPYSLCESFNISSPVPTSVMELAEMIWQKINPDKPFNCTFDDPYEYDVQKRIPCVEKARRILGFETEISLEESVDEVIHYIKNNQPDKLSV